MRVSDVARLGRDAELRHAGRDSTPVVNLSLAFDYRDRDNQKEVQWVEGALWGRQAEALEQYLTKGREVFVSMSDVHMETYEGRDGTGHKLVGRIEAIRLVGSQGEREERGGRDERGSRGRDERQSRSRDGGDERGSREPPRREPPRRDPPSRSQSNKNSGTGFDAMDDDIPF